MRIPLTGLAGSLLGASTALAACSDPALVVEVRHDDPALRDQLTSLTLAVVELLPHPDGTPVDCDEVRYGRISRDQLDGGRRASTSAGAHLTGVPRLGEKLVILEGRDRAGARIAGGCEPLGDVEADTTVQVHVEIAPRVRLAGQRTPRDPSDPPGDFELVLFQPWREDDRFVTVPGQTMQIDVRDRAADRTQVATATTCGDPAIACTGPAIAGVATISLGALAPTLQPGPVEVIVRAPWVEEPLVVRAFAPLTRMEGGTIGLAPLATPRASNQAAPSWAFLPDGSGLRAAAIFVSGGEARTHRIVLVHRLAGELRLNRREIIVNEPVYALVTWREGIWTRTSSGWRVIDFADGTLAAGQDGPTEPATELIALAPCDGGDIEGLLVRAGTGPYVAFDNPRRPHAADSDALGKVTAEVNRIVGGRTLGTVCLTYPYGARRTVIVRGEQTASSPIGTFLVHHAVTDAVIRPSPIASGFLGYRSGTWRLAGAALDVTGPRLDSYSFGAEALVDGDDGRLEGELTTLPSTTAVLDRDADGALDVVATSHQIVDETRVQLTYLARDGRAALTGLSPAIPGVAPIVAVERVTIGGGVRHVAMVATSDLFTILDLGAP